MGSGALVPEEHNNNNNIAIRLYLEVPTLRRTIVKVRQSQGVLYRRIDPIFVCVVVVVVVVFLRHRGAAAHGGNSERYYYVLKATSYTGIRAPKPSKAVKSHLKLYPHGLATQGTTSKQYFGHSIRIFMPPENARSSAYALRSERSGGSLDLRFSGKQKHPLEVVFLKSSPRYLNNHRQMAVTHS